MVILKKKGIFWGVVGGATGKGAEAVSGGVATPISPPPEHFRGWGGDATPWAFQKTEEI